MRLSHVKRLSRHKPSACMRLTKYQYKRLQADIGGLTTIYAIIKAEKNKEKEPKPRVRFRFLLAEGEGFEPPDRCRSSVFKTDAIDHSANLPYRRLLYQKCARVSTVSAPAKPCTACIKSAAPVRPPLPSTGGRFADRYKRIRAPLPRCAYPFSALRRALKIENRQRCSRRWRRGMPASRP